MNGTIGMMDYHPWFQSQEETKLKRDAPPFIPKARTYRTLEEQKLTTPSLKPNAQPFIPRNRLSQPYAYNPTLGLPLYPAMPFYPPTSFPPFTYVNYQTPFLPYVPMHPPAISIPQPSLSLNIPILGMERNSEEIVIEDISPLANSELEEYKANIESDLDSSIGSESMSNVESILVLEVDEDEGVALPRELIDELTNFIPIQKFEGGKFNNDACSVCLESFVSEDLVKVLECKHVFHQKCIDPWLKKTLKCPLCRHLLI